MKRLLLSLILSLALCTGCVAGLDSLTKQTQHCQKLLWYEQKQFNVDQIYMTVVVKRAKDMTHLNAWGSVDFPPSGPVIEIMAMEDYTAGMSAKERQHQQDEVVVHEVLHVVLTREGVPMQAQDEIIEAIRPGVRLP